MRFRVAVGVLSIALAACNPTPSRQASATISPTTPASPVRMLPDCSEPTTAIFAIHVTAVNGGVSGDSIFCVSVAGIRNVNSRLLEDPVQARQLLAADARLIVQLDGGNVDASNVVGVFDALSQDSRSLGTLSSLGVGDPGPVAAVMSPDGTQFALGSAHKLLLIDLPSGSARTLATVAADRWLMPLRWTAHAIIAHKVPFEGMGDFGLLDIDPDTGTISTLNQGPNNQLVVSPAGKFLVSTTNVDLGDGPTVRYPWQNAIELTGPDGTKTRIASRKDRWFTPLDVTDDGRVLFASDTQTGPIAPDMGLYLAEPGHVKMQLSSMFAGEWMAARFVDASTALVAHPGGGSGDAETSLNLEAIQMCSDTQAGCQVQTSGDAVFNGQWPTVITSIVMVPAAA